VPPCRRQRQPVARAGLALPMVSLPTDFVEAEPAPANVHLGIPSGTQEPLWERWHWLRDLPHDAKHLVPEPVGHLCADRSPRGA